MIEETALVAAIDGEWAWLETERNSSCGKCSARGACGVSLIDKISGPRQESVRAINSANARVGDRVIVGLREDALVKGSAILYLGPLLGLFAGAVLAEILAPFNTLLSTETTSIILGIAGLAAGLLQLRRYSRRNGNDPRYQPVVLRTLQDTQDSTVQPVRLTSPGNKS